jgi:hypothetical protein
MGLFNSAKKKNIPLDSEAIPPPPLPSGAQQPIPIPSADEKEEIDFDSLLDEALIPPSGLSASQAQGVSAMPLPAQAIPDIDDFPELEIPAQKKQEQPVPVPDMKAGFEIPDFMEEEAKAIEQEKQIEKESLKKQEPAPPEPAKAAPLPEQQKPKISQESIKIETYREPQQPKPFPEKINWTAEEIRAPVRKELKEPFIDVNRYFEIKDDFEEIRKHLSACQDLIEHDAALSNEKSDKYQSMAESLNYLQEKLMLMDTKLFES